MKRVTLVLAILLSATAAYANFASFMAANTGVFDSTLKVGGGGWIVGLSASSDGTFVARTDTYGAYIGTPSAFTSWTNLLSQSRIPSADWNYVGTDGVTYDAVISPTDSNYVYMIFNSLFFYSSNKGATFTQTSTAQFPKLTAYCGAPFRQNDYHMAVDPANKLHLLVGTPLDGLRETFDGGATFAAVSAIPTATSDGNRCGNNNDVETPGYILAFDPHSATTGSGATLRSSIAYVYAYEKINLTSASWSASTMTFVASVATRIQVGDTFIVSGMSVAGYNGTWTAIAGSSGTTIKATNAVSLASATGGAIEDPGMYSTANGGTTWGSAINVGGPYGVQNMVVGSDGIVWLTDTFNGSQGIGYIWKYASSTWTKYTSEGANFHSITVAPTPTTVTAGTGQCGQTDTWNGSSWGGTQALYARTADALIGWLTYANTFCLSNGAQVFDPSQSNLLVFGHGVGVSSTTLGSNNFKFITAGIEQMISRAVIAPHGIPIVGVEDKGTFQISSPGTYPSQNNNTYLNSYTLDVTSALDWAKFTNTNFVCSVTFANVGTGGINSGCSTDGGATFKPFNSWLADAPAANLSVDGSSRIVISGLNTTGLSTWSAGSGSIVRVIQAGVASSPNLSWAVTVNSGSQITLQGSISGTNFNIAAGATYRVYVDTGPQSNYRNNLAVTGTASDGGLIKVTVTNQNSGISNGDKVCLSGVGGTTEANGCWVAQSVNPGANTLDLGPSSIFTNAWTSGGTMTRVVPTGGSIAVSTPSNIILTPSNNDFPYCTQDGGLTWAQLRSTPTSGDTGWGFANYNRTINWVADPNTVNHFWGYSYIDGTFQVTNCTISLVSATLLPSAGAYSNLRAVPGHQNVLFYTAGPATGQLSKSTDGGLNWAAMANITEPQYIDIGPVASGQTDPTMYVFGQVNDGSGVKTGMFRSTNPLNATPSWTRVSAFPGDSIDNVNCIAADQVTWNKWYLCHQGSSFAHGQQN